MKEVENMSYDEAYARLEEIIPAAKLEAMGYVFEAQEAVDENNTLVRFVTSWATPVEAVDQFLKDLAACK